ncbi:MAG: pseudouridine synthase [Bdellovibrionaceae bacterium]|nr:pseudouridine synthase [Pseudobdellovibrionaceae bacterium]
MDKVRISKLFSEKQIASRRTTEKWVENQWISVDGEILKSPGQVIDPRSLILVNVKAQHEISDQVTVILNKPPGFVSTFNDPKYAHALSLIQKKNFYTPKDADTSSYSLSYKEFDPVKLGPAGRLDAPSRGLMLYTQDGTLAKKIIGEASEIDKEYIVKVRGSITPDKLKKLGFGLSLDGQKLKPAEVTLVNKDQKILRFILREGKNRQIRRMCQLVDLQVIDLLRVRIGKLHLNDLPEGKWQFLDPNTHTI